MVSRLYIWVIMSAAFAALWYFNLVPFDSMYKAIWISGATLAVHWFANVLMAMRERKPIILPEDKT